MHNDAFIRKKLCIPPMNPKIEEGEKILSINTIPLEERKNIFVCKFMYYL
jgi:hypothetical protein